MAMSNALHACQTCTPVCHGMTGGTSRRSAKKSNISQLRAGSCAILSKPLTGDPWVVFSGPLPPILSVSRDGRGSEAATVQSTTDDRVAKSRTTLAATFVHPFLFSLMILLEQTIVASSTRTRLALIITGGP